MCSTKVGSGLTRNLFSMLLGVFQIYSSVFPCQDFLDCSDTYNLSWSLSKSWSFCQCNYIFQTQTPRVGRHKVFHSGTLRPYFQVINIFIKQTEVLESRSIRPKLQCLFAADLYTDTFLICMKRWKVAKEEGRTNSFRISNRNKTSFFSGTKKGILPSVHFD